MLEDSEIPNKKIPKIMKMSFHDILRKKSYQKTSTNLNHTRSFQGSKSLGI